LWELCAAAVDAELAAPVRATNAVPTPIVATANTTAALALHLDGLLVFMFLLSFLVDLLSVVGHFLGSAIALP
jgi:hypothetical protein